MARLPQPGGDNGNWGSILNDYLAQSHDQNGALKPGVVGSSQLSPAVKTSLSTADNAVTLSGDQQIEGIKTFVAPLYAKTAVVVDGVNKLKLVGEEYPGISSVNSATQTTSQLLFNPSNGSAIVDYSASRGGSFAVRAEPGSTDLAFSVGPQGDAVFGGNVTLPTLRMTYGNPSIGKVLTSDATGNATWQTPTISGSDGAGESIKLKELYQPIIGVIPSTEITQDQYFHDDLDSTGYTGMTGTLWNSPHFNTQSQNFKAANETNPAFGCTNMTNGRQVGSVFDFEFEFTGDKFAIHIQAFGYYDTQIYVEHEGQMMKIKPYPLADDYSGFTFRSIKFSRYATRRIRILMPFLYFFQIIHENNAVIKKTPDRPMIAITGDSYVDASTGYNAGSSRSYVTAGVVDAIIEATGFAVLRLGQGGTGYFNNASGTASDALGPADSTRFFSSQRLTSLKATGVGSLVALVVNGTVNDGELSGGTTAMKARALAGYQAVNDWDPGISIIAVTPEPVNNPTAGNVHDLNRIGIIQAIGDHPQGVGVVDVFDPANPLWTGSGTEASPTIDQQSKLVGMDGIHGNWAGYKLYGHYISMNMGEMKVPIERAWL
ncbi:SGNH/GDSL hydrolase family protein [bacterium]|nr:MAG: SGNH/GDSL hydrolase family protein [bacterium]